MTKLVFLFVTSTLIVGVFADVAEVPPNSPVQTNAQYEEVKIASNETVTNLKIQHEDIDEDFTDSEYIPVDDKTKENITEESNKTNESKKLNSTIFSNETTYPKIAISMQVNNPQNLTVTNKKNSLLPLEGLSLTINQTAYSNKVFEENVTSVKTHRNIVTEKPKLISNSTFVIQAGQTLDAPNSTSVSIDKSVSSSEPNNSTAEKSRANFNSTSDAVKNTTMSTRVTTEISSEISISTEATVSNLTNSNSSTSSMFASNSVSTSVATNFISLTNEDLISNTSLGTTAEDVMNSEVTSDFDSSSLASDTSDTTVELKLGENFTSYYSKVTKEASKIVPLTSNSTTIQSTPNQTEVSKDISTSSTNEQNSVTEITQTSESFKDSTLTERPTSVSSNDSTSTERPTSESSKDGILTERPTSESSKDGILTERPTSESSKDSILTERPTNESSKDSILTERPTSESSKVGSSTEEPTIAALSSHYASSATVTLGYFSSFITTAGSHIYDIDLSPIPEESSPVSSEEDLRSSTSERTIESSTSELTMHVVAVPMLRKVKIALAVVFLSIGLIALVFLIIFFMKARKPSIDYEELSLVP